MTKLTSHGPFKNLSPQSLPSTTLPSVDKSIIKNLHPASSLTNYDVVPPIYESNQFGAQTKLSKRAQIEARLHFNTSKDPKSQVKQHQCSTLAVKTNSFLPSVTENISRAKIKARSHFNKKIESTNRKVEMSNSTNEKFNQYSSVVKKYHRKMNNKNFGDNFRFHPSQCHMSCGQRGLLPTPPASHRLHFQPKPQWLSASSRKRMIYESTFHGILPSPPLQHILPSPPIKTLHLHLQIRFAGRYQIPLEVPKSSFSKLYYRFPGCSVSNFPTRIGRFSTRFDDELTEETRSKFSKETRRKSPKKTRAIFFKKINKKKRFLDPKFQSDECSHGPDSKLVQILKHQSKTRQIAGLDLLDSYIPNTIPTPHSTISDQILKMDSLDSFKHHLSPDGLMIGAKRTRADWGENLECLAEENRRYKISKNSTMERGQNSVRKRSSPSGEEDLNPVGNLEARLEEASSQGINCYKEDIVWTINNEKFVDVWNHRWVPFNDYGKLSVFKNPLITVTKVKDQTSRKRRILDQEEGSNKDGVNLESKLNEMGSQGLE